MSSSKNSPSRENEGRPDLPESIADHIRKLYAEYIKPELFLQWLVEQEFVKRKLDEQQRKFEFQHQLALTHAERNELFARWERNEQFNGKHIGLRQQHNGGSIEDSSSDGTSSSTPRD